MTIASSTRFRATRFALAAVGLTAALLAVAHLLTFTSGISGLPSTICLHPHDVACSSDYFLGRDRAEHVAQLTAVAIGLVGLGLVASGLWTRHLRSPARV